MLTQIPFFTFKSTKAFNLKKKNDFYSGSRYDYNNNKSVLLLLQKEPVMQLLRQF